jgi:photosystem II stability/assembly factor-like uncharacterized protein
VVVLNRGLAHLRIRLLAISPAYSSDKILLALGIAGELYRTQDRGESWQQVLGVNGKVTAMAFSFAMDTTRLFIGDEKGGVYASTDSGYTWEQPFRLSNEDAITCIAVSPNSSSDATIFLGTKKSGVIKKIVGAGPYVAVNDGLFEPTARSGEYVTSLIVSPYYPIDSTVFASTWYSGVFRSDNGGKTWKKYSNGLTSDRQADTAQFKSPHFSSLRISQSFPKDKTIFLAGYDGLFKSTDGGNLWLELQTLSKQLIKTLALSPRYKDDSTIAFSTFFAGAYLSTDQGTTWQSINSGSHDSHLIDIAFSPNFRSDDAIFSISNGSFYRTTGRRKSWEPIKLGYYGWRRSLSTFLSKIGLPRMALLSESEKALPFPVVIVVSPDFEADHTVYLGTRYQGIFKSMDGGLKWFRSLRLLRRRITALVISPDFKSDKTLYAGVAEEGIYKTVDGGETWRSIYQDHGDNVLLAIPQNYKENGTILAVTRQGLIKTTDRGKSWEGIDTAHFGGDVVYESIAISKIHIGDEVIIASLKGKGLFRVSNNKISMEICPNILDNDYTIKQITFSPSFDLDQTIYFIGDEAIFRSTNGGHTCELVRRS